MISFNRNSCGYHETGGRFDYFCISGFAYLIDTCNPNDVGNGWENPTKVKAEAEYLNSGSVFSI